MRPEQVKRLTRTALVLEVLLPSADRERDFVQITTSMPGREGTMTRTWYMPHGMLDAQQWLDITGWINLTIDQLLTVLGGAQGTLPV